MSLYHTTNFFFTAIERNPYSEIINKKKKPLHVITMIAASQAITIDNLNIIHISHAVRNITIRLFVWIPEFPITAPQQYLSKLMGKISSAIRSAGTIFFPLTWHV